MTIAILLESKPVFRVGIIAVFTLLTLCTGSAQQTNDPDDGHWAALIRPAEKSEPAAAAPPTEEGYEARRRWLLGLFCDQPLERHSKKGLPEALARLYLAKGQNEEALEYISRNIPGKSDMFDCPPVARALYMFGEHFSDEQIQRIKEAVTSAKVTAILRRHGTDNHAAMSVASAYLFAQYFPGATWDTGGGKRYSSEQMMAEARDHILRRGRGFYRTGNNEQLSSTYFTCNIYPFLALMEFAKDPQVRDAAEALVLYHLAMVALNNFDGHLIPPFNRRNALQQRFGPSRQLTGRYMPNFHRFAWLFWGQNQVVPGDFTAAAEPAYPLFYALSDRRLPEPLNRIARGAEAPYEIRGALSEFSHWGSAKGLETLRYVWRDRDYAVGGIVAQHIDPGQFLLDYHTFGISWKSPNRFRSLEVMHPYWRSNLGEDHWRATHSPFQQAGLHRNTAIVMFDIPEKDPWPGRADQKHWLDLRDEHYDRLIQLAQARFPTTVDELTCDGDFYFLCEANVYVAIRVLKPGHTLHKLEDEALKALDGYSDPFYVIKSREARNGFVFEVGTALKHGSFQAFQETIRANRLTVDWDELEVRYQNSNGDELRFRYDTDRSENSNGDQLRFRYDTERSEGQDGFIWFAPDLWINGERRDISGWPVADSPVVSLRDSVLKVKQGGDWFAVDWSGELPRIERP